MSRRVQSAAQAKAAAEAVFEARVIVAQAMRDKLSPIRLDDRLHRLEMEYWAQCTKGMRR